MSTRTQSFCTPSSGDSGRRLGASGSTVGALSSASAADLVYYVSLACSDVMAASYKLLVSEIPSQLELKHYVHGELCPGSFLYHHYEHAHSGERKNIRFKFVLHTGDACAC